MRLGRIGFDQVVGYLEDGLHSVESRPDLMVSTERLSAQVAAERVAVGTCERAPVMVDVRDPASASRNASPGAWASRSAISANGCRSCRPIARSSSTVPGGYRSSIAASLLQRHGFTQVSEIAGGIAAWDAGKLPLET